jgi:hypothetical protein
MAKQEKKYSRKTGRRDNLLTWGVAIAVMAAVFALETILSHCMTVLLSGALLLPSIIAIVVAFKKREARGAVWGVSFGFVGGLVSFMGLGFTVSAYSFYEEPFIPFWEICLAVGLLVSVFVTVKWIWKGTGWGGRIGSIVVCTCMVFLFCWIPLCHLNYLLDFEPTEIHAVIEEKEKVRHRKSPDSYEFEMTVDGETFDLEVGRREYNRYEVGDTYTFYEYKGAFGKPFYIAEQ